MCHCNCRKNREIENLRKSTEHNEPAACTNPQTFNLNFIDFDGDFSTEQLSELRFIGSTKSEDSTIEFMKANYLYEGRLNVLQTKSITGGGKKGKKNELLTPKNVDLIKRIFSERVDCTAKDDEEKIIRKKNLKK